MRGDEKVIEQLNAALSAELTAIAQYMVQAEMCESWGFHRLADLTKARAIKEMHHAEGLIERIIFLDGTPAINVPLTPKVGSTVQEQLQLDYDDEADAVRQYNAAASHLPGCRRRRNQGPFRTDDSGRRRTCRFSGSPIAFHQGHGNWRLPIATAG